MEAESELVCLTVGTSSSVGEAAPRVTGTLMDQGGALGGGRAAGSAACHGQLPFSDSALFPTGKFERKGPGIKGMG